MSIRVLLCEYPNRAIALVTETHALIFRHSTSSDPVTLINGSTSSFQTVPSRTSSDGAGTPRCMVEFTELSRIDLSDFRTLSASQVHGTLGLITISGDVFLCVVTGAVKVATVRPGETVEKIYGVDFYCLNNSEYDNVPSDLKDFDPYKDSLREEAYDYHQQLARREPLEHPCMEIQKLLSNGTFYYSTDFDLTNRLQDRNAESTEFDVGNLDESFLWNSYMISPLVKFRSQLVSHEREALDASRILTSAIRGFVNSMAVPINSAPMRSNRTTGLPASLTLISRLSCRRAGTRFNSRGIDDDGNVANFVESETIYWSPSGVCFSYAQIRGSVPVFWEQAPGLLPGQQKISITRSAQATQPAFDKHFEDLEHNYGGVHVVNLLSETKPGEAELTKLYQYGVKHASINQVTDDKNASDHKMLRETEFDFHAETKGPSGYEAASMIRRYIENSADGFAYYLQEQTEDPHHSSENSNDYQRAVVVLQQEGVFRTNCLDCLDRTNLIQTIISQMAIEAFLNHRGERAGQDFWVRHSSLWADNGDALSKTYAGTGALKTSFTRSGKMSLAGAFADARKSATRLYINNFADKGRQNTIDMLLGRLMGQTPVHLYDPINDYVNSELNRRQGEYTSTEMINLWVGTYNLNGRITGYGEDLSSWLCPDVDSSQQFPEIVAVGFQEIVELSPQQIMNSDPTRKQEWERSVRKTLNKHARAAGREDYVLLRSGQLVGAALCIFVKASVLKDIKNVEGSVKKTGMSGLSGNKGAVAIRMDYANTQLCFVTAHLAAGFANYEERNRDYHTIHHGLKFARNRGIDDHDTVIFLGDFNYRIGLGSEKVRHLIDMGDLDTLYENDQLNLQMMAGLTFPFYSESRITFMPTYKYDLGTDRYDTSEKARIPAWTDRILRKGSNIRQIHYSTADLKFSDHRPVFATFQCTISIIDSERKEALSRKLFEKRRGEVGDPVLRKTMDDSDDDDLIGYDPIEPGLPPASSDRRKWWLDNAQPAKSDIQPSEKGAVPNPHRPVNPWTPTDEPDWVRVPRMKPGRMDSYQSDVSAAESPKLPPRKLPPAFMPPSQRASNGADLQGNFSQISLIDRDVSPRPTSVLSTSSHASSQRAKPPIAKKPTHLAYNTPGASGLGRSNTVSPAPRRDFAHLASNPASSSSSSSSSSSGLGRSNTTISPAPRRNVAPLNHTAFPPPPKSRRASGPPGPSQLQSVNQAKTPPALPPPRRARKPVGEDHAPGVPTVPRLPPRPTDLLGADADAGADALSGWETLKPS